MNIFFLKWYAGLMISFAGDNTFEFKWLYALVNDTSEEQKSNY